MARTALVCTQSYVQGLYSPLGCIVLSSYSPLVERFVVPFLRLILIVTLFQHPSSNANPRHTSEVRPFDLHDLRVHFPSTRDPATRPRFLEWAQIPRRVLILPGASQVPHTRHHSLLQLRRRGTRAPVEQSILLSANHTPEITLRVFHGAPAMLVPVQLSGPPPDRFYDVDLDNEGAMPSTSARPCPSATS